MKPSTILAVIALSVSTIIAQDKGTGQPEKASSEQSNQPAARPVDFGYRGGSTLSLEIAYGSFSVASEERFGPTVVFQYSPSRMSMPAVEYFAGVLFKNGSSDAVNPKDYVPVQSYLAPFYSPYSNYQNDYAYRMPNYSIGLAFIGADVTFYMLQGDVRPYVGIGGALAFWPYANQLSGTFAPDAKAGLDIRMSNSFSGFAEVRRMFGVPNLLGLDTPKFGGLTSAAIGFSFAPRFR